MQFQDVCEHSCSAFNKGIFVDDYFSTYLIPECELNCNAIVKGIYVEDFFCLDTNRFCTSYVPVDCDHNCCSIGMLNLHFKKMDYFAYTCLIPHIPLTLGAQRSLFITQNKMFQNQTKFRIRKLPNCFQEEPLRILCILNKTFGLDLNWPSVVSCDPVPGWFRDQGDVVITFTSRKLRRKVFILAKDNIDILRKIIGKRVHIVDELSSERYRIMKEARKEFGSSNVRIKDGGVHIYIKKCKTVYRLLTLSQYREFVRNVKWPFERPDIIVEVPE